jgi:hypothetical protein
VTGNFLTKCRTSTTTADQEDWAGGFAGDLKCELPQQLLTPVNSLHAKDQQVTSVFVLGHSKNSRMNWLAVQPLGGRESAASTKDRLKAALRTASRLSYPSV